MKDIELLKRYLQNEIDTGSHKIFVFDKDYNAIEFKVIEALNEINNLQSQLQQKENIIKEAREYIRSKSIKFTMAYVEDDGRIDLSRSNYRIDKLTSKQVKELLEILDKENI